MKQAWQTARDRLRAVGVEAPDVDAATLEVYAREGTHSDPVENLVYGYGLALYDAFDGDQLNTWKLKLVFPEGSDCEAAQQALSGETISYEAAVNKLAGPVTRLVAIHLYNALKANRVSLANAKDLDLSTWGATEAFYKGQTPFSLVPLTYAYGPRWLSDSFAAALEALAVDQLAKVTHSQVKDRFRKLIVELAQP